jgi:hypothetical protein
MPIENIDDYKRLMTEVIEKQSVILGPQIAIMKARSVEGVSVSDSGEVTEIGGEPRKALESLIDRYVELSGQIVKATLGSIFMKYPGLDENENNKQD